MEEAKYDEFGNYVGEALSEESGDESSWSDASEEGDDALDAVMRDAAHEEVDEAAEVAAMDDAALEAELAAQQAAVVVHQASDIVQHADKDFFASAQQVYGEDVEVLVQDEDTMTIEQAIVEPPKEKCFAHQEKKIPRTTYDSTFLAKMMDTTGRQRIVAVVGALHHGKTSLLDVVVRETHPDADAEDVLAQVKSKKSRAWAAPRATQAQKIANRERRTAAMRYTDSRFDEQKRGLSLKATPMTVPLPSLRKEQQHLLTLIDCPGHTNFTDEAIAGMRLADGIICVVDVAEGVLMQTERLLRHAAMHGLRVTVLLNKLDRLILELRLPPRDIYLKLQHTLQGCNAVLSKFGYDGPRLSPLNGNVLFGATQFGTVFSVESFAKLYANYHNGDRPEKDPNYIRADVFAKRLWGDVYLDPRTRRFVRQRDRENNADLRERCKVRTFVSFILTPLVKVFSHALGHNPSELPPLLSKIGVRLAKRELHTPPRTLLRTVLRRFCGDLSALTQVLVDSVPAPNDPLATQRKLTRAYLGVNLPSSKWTQMALRCASHGPLLADAVKLVPRADGSELDALVRVHSGVVKVGDRIRVLRPSQEDEQAELGEESISVREVTGLWLLQGGRYKVAVNQARAGNVVLVAGVADAMDGAATLAELPEEIVGDMASDDAQLFRPLPLVDSPAHVKVAVEPVKPSELPQLLAALRAVSRCYPSLRVKGEESGERVVVGVGELQLDCALHDVRCVFADNIEVRVADPVVSFRETVTESSAVPCAASTHNKRNKLTFAAAPLDQEVAKDLEQGRVSMEWPKRKLAKFFTRRHGWDKLAARSIWALAPATHTGTNVLLDDTLASMQHFEGDEADEARDALLHTQPSIVQGFQWATREGPLCAEPVRGTMVRLLEANLDTSDPLARPAGQVIPAARRATYASFLTATPRLLEPVLRVEVLCPADCIAAIAQVAEKRRGRVIDKEPLSGTPLFKVTAELPAMDSFGFETDVRSYTSGMAFPSIVFDRWDLVPGDPLNRDVQLRVLEPLQPHELAREFLVKTRLRKGMSDDVVVHKYFDDDMLLALAKSGAAEDALGH